MKLQEGQKMISVSFYICVCARTLAKTRRDRDEAKGRAAKSLFPNFSGFLVPGWWVDLHPCRREDKTMSIISGPLRCCIHQGTSGSGSAVGRTSVGVLAGIKPILLVNSDKKKTNLLAPSTGRRSNIPQPAGNIPAGPFIKSAGYTGLAPLCFLKKQNSLSVIWQFLSVG